MPSQEVRIYFNRERDYPFLGIIPFLYFKPRSYLLVFLHLSLTSPFRVNILFIHRHVLPLSKRLHPVGRNTFTNQVRFQDLRSSFTTGRVSSFTGSITGVTERAGAYIKFSFFLLLPIFQTTPTDKFANQSCLLEQS